MVRGDHSGHVVIRLLRGQVAIRETPPKSSVIWTPDDNQRQVKIHHGVVLGVGAPRLRGDVEVPYGFAVGDVVLYTFQHHREGWTHPWPEDGGPATWVPAYSVQAVIEP